MKCIKPLRPLLICLLLLFYSGIFSQDTLQITFLDTDTLSYSKFFHKLVQKEILDLLESRRQVEFKMITTGSSTNDMIRGVGMVMQDPQTDIVVGLGLVSSMILAQVPAFPKPTISSIIIDRDIQGLEVTDEGTSGKDNYTFIETPYDVKRDLEVFHQMYPYKRLGILMDLDIGETGPLLQRFFSERVPENIPFEFLSLISIIAFLAWC